MANEKFCLRWNDFESNISVAFRELRDDKDFFDVTLACDEDQIQAHKVILSACSPFFRSVLRKNPHAHPLLYLKGVKFSDLQSVLNFMYHGEVNVAQEELNSFLAVAEELRVKGLTQNQSSKKTESSYSAPPPKPAAPRLPDREPAPPPKRSRPAPIIQSSQHSLPLPEDDDIQEVVPVKSEPREAPLVQQHQAQPAGQEMYSHALQAAEGDYGAEEQYEDYGQYEGEGYDAQEAGDGNKVYVEQSRVASFIEEQSICEQGGHGSKTWRCAVCGKCLMKKCDLVRHVESFHVVTDPYSCEFCSLSQFKTIRALQRHMNTVHK